MSTELLVRLRKDLIFVPRNRQGSEQWVVKDPVSCQNFLFSAEEFRLLQLFDGQRTYDEIRNAWQNEFCTQALTSEQVDQFGQRLVQDQLGFIDRPGLGRKYHDVEQSTRVKQRNAKWQSPIVIRLGGLDPTPVLEFFSWLGYLLFHRISIALTFLTTLLMAFYFMANIESIGPQLPTFSQFFSPKNVLLMFGILAITKFVHELGHGLACRHYGGECLEIGVILLAFIPTLYCDVSDAWTFRDRWKRMMVSFAGIYVELLLANTAALVWLLTEPGLANSTAFNVAMMCSLNTLLINGNPLLKYDGYYILSDWWEKPNLTQRAKLAFRTFCNRAWLNIENGSDTNRQLIWFGALSTMYRWFVLASIILGLYYVLNRFEIGIVSETVVVVLSIMMITRMAYQFRMEGRMIRGSINWYRTAASLIGLGLISILFFWMPLPSSIYCRFEIEAKDLGVVYAPENGQLISIVPPETEVTATDVVANLCNDSVRFRLDKAEQYLAHLKDRRQRVIRQIDAGLPLASELNLVQSEIDKRLAEIKLLKKEIDGHEILAGRAGILKAIATERQDRPGETIQPLLRQNNGCYVKRGQPLFSIENKEHQLVAVVGERNVEFLEIGQAVQLRFVQSNGERIEGKITKIVETELNLNAGKAEQFGLDFTIDNEGNQLLTETPYRVVIEVPTIPAHAMIGSSGHARISVAQSSASQKLAFFLDRWWNEL